MSAPRRGRRNVRGRAGGPVCAQCEVLARRRAGAYWTLSLSAPEIADRAAPGRFVNIATGAQSSLLRRPFSIAAVSSGGPAAGTVDVVVDAHGPGTGWLARVREHERLDVVGPLGSPFPLPRKAVPCLLVGGGYGTAPLLYLADKLNAEGMRVDMISGAASQDRLHNTIRAKRITASVTFTTEDGSQGETGRVTDVFDEVVERTGAAVVYACGPMPMLRAVSERCDEHDLPHRLAVEEHMACGVGVCWTCVVPTTTGDGDGVRMRRACIDGPVLNGGRIAWEHSRWARPAPPPEPEEPAADEAGDELTGDDVWAEQ